VSGRMRPVATGFVILVVIGLALNRNFYHLTAIDMFFSITLASTVIVFLRVRPVGEFLQLFVATALLILLQAAALNALLRTTPALALLGTSSLALLASRRICSVEEECERLHYAFLPTSTLAWECS